MNEFVLDCSVALSWCFPDESDPYAASVSEAMRKAKAHVPSVWWLEVANGILVAERRGRLVRSDIAEFSLILSSIRIEQDTDLIGARMDELIALARRYSLSSYDASYLDLAIKRGLPLATLDGRLREAVAKAGVGIYQP